MPKDQKLQRGPSQREIAKAMGLSQSTVTVALSENPAGRLAKETVAKIREHAARVGYRPNRAAQMMRTGRSHTIGVVYTSGSVNYHLPQERVKHLARSTTRAGYQLISIDLDWFDRDLRLAQDYLLKVAAEGVIFCNISDVSQLGWVDFLRKRSLPAISMSSGIFKDFDEAKSDLRSAFDDMTRHMIEQGGRKIALLLSFHDYPLGSAPDYTLAERVNGFAKAVSEAGGRLIAEPMVREHYDLPVNIGDGKSGIEGVVLYPIRENTHGDAFDLGYHEMLRFIGEPRRMPDSLVCANDDIAVGAIAACREHRIGIPEMIRISGADNAPFSRYCGIPLTTIEQPSERSADWCVNRLVELIENRVQGAATKQKFFRCKLILRESTVDKNTNLASA